MSRRILIVQLADIGDLILSTPALAALREADPDAHIALLTTAHSAPVLPDDLVDDLILFDKHTFDSPKALLKPSNLRRALALAARLRRGRYDTTIFLHHFTTRFGALKFAALAWSAGSMSRIGLDNGSGFFLTDRLPDGGFGAKHQAQYWLDLVGVAGADSTPRPASVKTVVSAGAGLRPASPKAPRIAIHAGSGGYSRARRWDAVSFAAVADRLAAELGAQIVLVGTPDDDGAAVRAAMRAEPLDLIGQTTLAELAGVLQSCDLMIGADSGVTHIAAAAGTPVVAIFGPSNADAWHPWTPGSRHVVVRSAPECSPCSYVGHGIGLREGCPARTCMRMVTPDQVVATAKALLNNTPSTPIPFPPLAWEKGGQAPRLVYVGEGRDAPASGVRGFEKRIKILGLPVSAITYGEWLPLIDAWVKGERAHHVCTINPEMIMIARRDPNFHNILSRADLTVPDGVGLLWAARRQATPLPERVTGSDGVPLIASEAAKRGWRLFLLGAAPGIADKAAEVLKAKHPDLQIVGTYSGSPAPDEEDGIVERVNAAGADILFVAYGAPEQDKWIARNLPRLRVKMAMGIGGSLDFVAGAIPRAPQSFQRLGLEWLYRLYLQPWRIRRMLRLPRFVIAVLLDKKRA
ncbi:MAG: WecB/TagA/CpsF family glycosyltransferase [Anaerolineae bacterium]|nr:WecB/TagA/CpsF family glycosyltransferase [Anaerolineae bacterium]